MLYVAGVDDWNDDILRCNGIYVMVIVGKVFDRAEGVIGGGMVHSTSLLSVFVVVQIETHVVCFLDLRQRSCVGHNSSMFEKQTSYF